MISGLIVCSGMIWLLVFDFGILVFALWLCFFLVSYLLVYRCFVLYLVALVV